MTLPISEQPNPQGSLQDVVGRCGSCLHWEPRPGYRGYCEVFDKLTSPHHGDKCTAHEQQSETTPKRADQRRRATDPRRNGAISRWMDRIDALKTKLKTAPVVEDAE